jgi:hypothetical protein
MTRPVNGILRILEAILPYETIEDREYHPNGGASLPLVTHTLV